jgi:septal ring factor EnvC (AmiA/AmiB activator)
MDDELAYPVPDRRRSGGRSTLPLQHERRKAKLAEALQDVKESIRFARAQLREANAALHRANQMLTAHEAGFPYELQDWSKKYGVTSEQLKASVVKVGPTAADIEKHPNK